MSVLFFDSGLERCVRPTVALHRTAAALAGQGYACQVVDFLGALPTDTLTSLCAPAAWIVVRTSGEATAEVKPHLEVIRRAAPGAQVILVGWLSDATPSRDEGPLQSLVDAVYGTGVDSQFLEFMLAALRGELTLSSRALWGASEYRLPDSWLGYAPCLPTGFRWKVRELGWEPVICDNVCSKCHYPACVLNARGKQEVPRMLERVTEQLEACIQAGATHIRLDDQTTDWSAEKLNILAQAHQRHPNVQWLLQLDAVPLYRNPEIIAALAQLPVAGVELRLPSFDGRAHQCSPESVGSNDAVLPDVRRAVGPEAFIAVAGYVGYPTEGAESVAALEAWAVGHFHAGTLDCLVLEQAFIIVAVKPRPSGRGYKATSEALCAILKHV